MKKLILTVASVAAATAFAGPVFAEPPIKLDPAGEIVIDIAAEETPCGAFTVVANDESKGRVFTRPDGTEVVHFAGPLSGVVTSVESGESLAINFSGPVWISPDQDVLTGAALIWNADVFELVRGRVVIPFGQAGNWLTRGSRTDLCALLNP